MDVKELAKAKYIFVGGKGGVGKTVSAGAMAAEIARQGKRVLLASLNPVHSLSSLFMQDLSGGTFKNVQGVEGLTAIEVEINDLIERYRSNMAARLKEFFKWAEIPINPEPFIQIATTNPAFQESAMFDKVMDIIVGEGGKYDVVVFDTAAVANAVRLIGLSKLYGLWLARMMQSRREAQEYRLKLSVRKEKVMEEIKKDPVVADLLSLYEKFTKSREALTDPSKTLFYFVTTPESLPISVVKRFINMVQAFNIPVGGIFVNMVLDRADVSSDPTGYLRSKWEEQHHYLDIINRDLGEHVKGYIRMYPTEIRGLEGLNNVIKDVYEFTPS
ncbi:MAG: ArsA family ATPase [Candidatus Caldarchaeum sp.]|uniref:Arsenic transporter n=1 Tax=Caldiarchaeum subterraneum TaxID=311458 RepID=A0A7C5LFM1_CALS0